MDYEIKNGVAIIPEGTKEIGNKAFNKCTELTSIVIPNSVKKIGELAFYGCINLKNIVIPKSVTEIGERAFYGCTGLESIVVDAGNNVYDSREGCNAIIETESNILLTGCKATIIPESVAKVNFYAFSGARWCQQSHSIS